MMSPTSLTSPTPPATAPPALPAALPLPSTFPLALPIPASPLSLLPAPLLLPPAPLTSVDELLFSVACLCATASFSCSMDRPFTCNSEKDHFTTILDKNRKRFVKSKIRNALARRKGKEKKIFRKLTRRLLPPTFENRNSWPLIAAKNKKKMAPEVMQVYNAFAFETRDCYSGQLFQKRRNKSHT